MLADAEKRKVFASSAVKLMTDLGFDGLDYDYEYVTNATQAADLIDLLNKTRTLMDDYAEEHGTARSLLTFDCPAGPLKYTLLDMEGMDQYLDFWNFMVSIPDPKMVSFQTNFHTGFRLRWFMGYLRRPLAKHLR